MVQLNSLLISSPALIKCTFWCRIDVFANINPALHILQWNGISSLCFIRRWYSRRSLRLNFSKQISHSNWFFLLCVIKCWIRPSFCRNFIPHLLQRKSVVFLCVSMCFFILFAVTRFSHIVHETLVSVWHRWCSIKYAFVFDVHPHSLHIRCGS